MNLKENEEKLIDIRNLTIKTSSGQILIKDITLDDFFELCRRTAKDYKLIAADLAGDIYYHQLDYDYPFVIAIGNEANGLEKEIVNNANYIVKIPINGGIDSLNAAIAAGIIMYKALEKN